MNRLAEISQEHIRDASCVNFLVVPGVAGSILEDKTCPHFTSWLDHQARKCSGRARRWVYNHDLQLEKLSSWDRYPSTGDDLLSQLLSMLQRMGLDDSIILIGHKLGCFLLKKALVTAIDRSHRPKEMQLLDMVEAIMMVGEPALHPKKPEDWIASLSECVSIKRTLPTRLANSRTIGCLQYISEAFERQFLNATSIDVHGTCMSRPKHRFVLKRSDHDGCICCTAITTRMWTTASSESVLEKGPGDASICPFHPKSAYYRTLEFPNGTLRLLPTAGSFEDVAPNDTGSRLTNDDIASQDHKEDSTSPTHTISGAISSRNAGSVEGSSTLLLVSDTMASNSYMQSSTFPNPRTTNDRLEENHNATHDVSTIEPYYPDTTATPLSTEESVQSAARKRQRAPHFSTSMPPKNDLFVGRTELLKMLKCVLVSVPKELSNPQDTKKLRPSLVWLTGNPGVGKTNIANEFVHRSAHNFEHVLWLNAATEASLGSCFHDCAVALGLVDGRVFQDHEISRACLLRRLQTSSRWLIVLDGVTKGIDFTRYIPEQGNGLIIATSRWDYGVPKEQKFLQMKETWSLAALETVSSVMNLTVSALRQCEAKKLLLRALHLDETMENTDAIAYIVSCCHTSPLVLRQLADWSIRAKTSIKEMAELLQIHVSHQSLARSNGQITLMPIMLNALDKDSTSVLCHISFLESSRMATRLLYTGHSCCIASRRNEDESDLILSQSIQKLWKYALLDMGEDPEVLCIHPLLQSQVRASLDDATWINAFSTACRSVRFQWPSRRKTKNILGGFWETFEMLHMHVHHLAMCFEELLLISEMLLDPGDEFKKLLTDHLWYSARRGNYREDRRLNDLLMCLLAKLPSDYTRDSQPILPRRCLEIPTDPRQIPRLVETKGAHAPYLALSWSWGLFDSVALTLATLNSRKQGINVSTLPRVLRDAISLSRFVGVAYLWVDCLCAVQDDPVEISEELVRFQDYFSNSLMTISALQSQHVRESLECETKNIDIYTIYRMPGARIWPSSVWDRVWTWQEVLLRPITSPRLSVLEVGDSLILSRDLLGLDGPSLSERQFSGSPSLTKNHFSHLAPTYVQEDKSKASPVSTHQSQTTAAENQHQHISRGESNDEKVHACQIPEACTKLDEGRSLLLTSSLLEATGSLVLSRDLLLREWNASSDALDCYLEASALLCTAYHLLSLDRLAVDIASAAERGYLKTVSEQGIESCYYGRLLLAMAVSLRCLGHTQKSTQKFEHSRTSLAFLSDQQNEWTAYIDIQLAEQHRCAGNFKEAHRLLSSSLEYFQAQSPSSKIQAHVAQILVRQSLVYEAEQNKMMQSAFGAAAQAVWSELVSEDQKANDSAHVSLSIESRIQKDVDELLDPWYR